MARYTADSKERVRDAVDMIDLVSTHTELRRAGANSYQGLCPFHEERTPSFGIDPVKKVYHCFGCGAGGDVFTFVQETQGLDFGGALELLAERYGVELELESEDPRAAERRRRRERLYALLERVAGYYARYLWEAHEAEGAREYLAGRGLQPEVLRRFRVGYAPSAWDHVYMRCRQAGFEDEELLAAGLAQRSRQRGTLYDRFRGRLTFPLCDMRGRVLGFGARALRDTQRPKYLNTAEGELYHKGRQLFGADLARAEASRARSAVVVEGYTDVLALHQAGIDTAVGLMGTAMTEQQVGELGRLVGPDGVVHLALDADASGQEAMLRASALAVARGLRVDVVPLPGEGDPADLVAREGADAVRARIERAVPLASFRIERVLADADLDSTEGRNRAFEALRAVLGAMPRTPEREDLVRLAAGRLRLSEQLAGLLTVAPPAEGGAGTGDVAALAVEAEPERTFLAMCIALPEPGREALRKLDFEAHFTSTLLRRGAAYLRDHLASPTKGIPGDDPELAGLVAELVLRADRVPTSAVALRVQTLQLEKARLERAIAAARHEAPAQVSDLAVRLSGVKDELDVAMDDAMTDRSGA
jgi:DNA primase